MPTAQKKILIKRKIKTKSPTLQFIINYERIILLFGPLIVLVVTALFIIFIENNGIPRFKEFFQYQSWILLYKKQATSSYNGLQDPGVVSETPPPLPQIDESKPLPEIISDLEESMKEMTSNNFTSALIQKIHDEAVAEMNQGNTESARQKLILAYKLAQEMYFAYQNKLNRFGQTTSSAD